jgi:hypothetical protein
MLCGGNFVPTEKLEGKESVVHWGKGNWTGRKVWCVPKKCGEMMLTMHNKRCHVLYI